MQKINATIEREAVLIANRISFSVDDNLDFVFNSKEDHKKAIKAFKKALVLK